MYNSLLLTPADLSMTYVNLSQLSKTKARPKLVTELAKEVHRYLRLLSVQDLCVVAANTSRRPELMRDIAKELCQKHQFLTSQDFRTCMLAYLRASDKTVLECLSVIISARELSQVIHALSVIANEFNPPQNSRVVKMLTQKLVPMLD